MTAKHAASVFSSNKTIQQQLQLQM